MRAMIISRITTHILRAPIPERTFYSSQAAFPERNSLLVRVEADNGLVGWGEGGQYGPPGPVASCVNDVLAPRLLHARADQPVKIWEQLYAFSRDFGRQSAYVEAISAIDIALWDLWGQHLGEPVHALLGGAFRDRVTHTRPAATTERTIAMARARWQTWKRRPPLTPPAASASSK
jgi:D-galactarolactone cycloisomerase